MEINGLPVFEALVNTEDTGMFKISLVDRPAVLTSWVAFAEATPMMYSIEDEDQHIIRGVVMRADWPIYRNDAIHGEFYIEYSAETIRLMAEKYLFDNNQNNVNLMHKDDTEGINMIQFFIKDSANGISPKGFEQITDGSLFAEYKVHNEEVWARIKDGTYKGFSLEGCFDVQPVEEADPEVDEILDLINKLKQKCK